MKIVPPKYWVSNPSSGWEREGTSRADRPQFDIIVGVVVFVVVVVGPGGLPPPASPLLPFVSASAGLKKRMFC